MRLLMILLTLLAAVPARAETSIFDVRSRLVQLLLSRISTPGSFEVTVEGVDSPGEGVTRLTGLKVADGQGVWITAGTVALSWNARALLSGELDVPQILVQDLAVLRPPAPGSQPPELKKGEPDPAASPFDWPRSPIPVTLGDVRLERIALAEAVLGHALRFDAIGRAQDRGDRQEIALTITRTDAVEGRIALSTLRDFAAGTLALRLDADEAAGGLIPALTGFPGDAASRFRLRAEGPREDWRLTFDSGTERVWRARGTAAVDFAAPLAVTADFALIPGPEAPADMAALLAPRATLSARLAEADGVVTLERLAVDTPALTLSAAGTLRRADTAFDLALSLAGGPQLGLLATGLALEGMTFDGTAIGTPEAFRAAGDARLTGLASALADAGTLALTVAVERAGTATDVALDGSGEGVRIDRLGPAVLGPITLAARARLEGEIVTLSSARLAAAPLAATVAGTAATDGQAADLRYGLALPDLAPLAAAYGETLTGRIEAGGRLALEGGLARIEALGELSGVTHALADLGSFRLRARAAQDAEGVAFDAEATGRGLRLDRLPPELLGEARLTLVGRLDGATLTLRQGGLTSPALTASLAGELDLAAITGGIGYQMATGDLAPLAAAYGQAVAGRIAAEGVATLLPGAVRLTGEAEAADAAAAGRRLAALTLSHDLTLGEGVFGWLTLAGEDADLGPIRAETALDRAGPRLVLTGLKAEALGLSVAGDLVLEDAAEGSLTLAGPLGPLGRVLGTPLAGAVDGRLALTARGGRQDATLTLSGKGVETDGLALARVQAQASVTDALGTPRLRATVSAADALAGPAAFRTLSVAAEGTPQALRVTLDGAGLVEAAPLTLGLTAMVDAPALRARTSRLEASLAGLQLRQQGPLSVAVTGPAVALSGIDLAIGKGRISGTARYAPAGIAADLTVTALDLGALDRIARVGIGSGTLEAKASLDSARGRADVTAEVKGLRLTDLSGIERPLSGTLSATWDGRTAPVKAELRSGRGAPFVIEASLPLRPGRPLPRLAPDGPLSGRVAWAGEIGQLWALVPLPGQELTGPARIDLTLSGTPAAPRIAGAVALDGGRFQDLTAGTILTDLTVTTRSGDGTALDLALTAKDGAAGRVEAQARLDLSGPPRIEASLTTREAVLVRRDDVHARISADLALAGPLSALALKGRIGIDRAELRLVDASPPAIIDLGPIRIRGDAAPEGGTAPTGGVTLDLTVSAPGAIFVRGRGLDSEWKADLTVTGTAVQPRLAGRIERLRGRFDLLGKAFDLTEGWVDFAGGRTIDPTLRVVLSRRGNGITWRIAVTGRASDPQIAFSSDPALPEDEVLPRLLFGTSRQSLSGAQALQLAAGINTLLSGRRGVLDTARDALGVDVLQVDPGQDATSVTLGKSVAPGLFVGARRDLTKEGNSAVTVEIDLFDGVKIEGEAGTERSSIGIEWSRDF